MQTFQTIRTALTAAGLKAYAVEECSGEGFVAFIRFDDLPAEGENAALDTAIRALAFDISDKGLVFKAAGK